jgi:hypothetical protein
MHVTYVVITILAALANGYAAFLNFIGAESVKGVADKVQVSRRWMIPFGILLASGALGLLIGSAVGARHGRRDRPCSLFHVRPEYAPAGARPWDRQGG